MNRTIQKDQEVGRAASPNRLSSSTEPASGLGPSGFDPARKAEHLQSLLDRLEQASGEDRELDALVRCAVFAPEGSFVQQSPINGAWCIYHGEYQGRPRSWEPRGLTQDQRLGSFTGSLDAALSLLPPGAAWRRLTEVSCSAYAASPYNAKAQIRYDGYGATPALQMCAAIMRLRLAPLLKAVAVEARKSQS